MVQGWRRGGAGVAQGWRRGGAGMAQGWHRDERTRLPPMWPRFDSRSRRHMRVEFVAGSLLAPSGFSPGTPVFSTPEKPTLPNSSLIRNARTHVKGAPERS